METYEETIRYGETLEVTYKVSDNIDELNTVLDDVTIDENPDNGIKTKSDIKSNFRDINVFSWTPEENDIGGTYKLTIDTETLIVEVLPAIDSVIDYFEDGNLNNYEGHLEAYSITSNSLSGEYSLLMESDPFVQIQSLSGLDNYPVKGDIVRYIARSDEGNGNIGAMIGADSGEGVSGEGVSGEINVRDGKLRLVNYIGDNDVQTVSVSLSANQTYEGVLEWHDGSGSEPEDTFVFTAYEWDGSRGAKVGRLSMQVSAASGNSGVGFTGFGTATVSMRLDEYGIVGSV
jgi:small nuclear ribonucleoprotein (snRNP)-like protein